MMPHSTLPSLCSLVVLLFGSAVFAHAEYQVPDSYANPTKTVSMGAGRYATGFEDDTGAFQLAIDDVNAAGGGHVEVPAGEYRLMNVALRSDVHVVFESGVTIRSPEGRTVNIFDLGYGSSVKNVSIVGPEDRVLVDFSEDAPDTRQRVFGIADCQNFRIANFRVNDNRTRFSSIILGWDGVRDGKPLHARDGLIENITANNAHYGYGCLQAHSGRNIVLRNIKSIGGSRCG